jgi:hypothetical protein
MNRFWSGLTIGYAAAVASCIACASLPVGSPDQTASARASAGRDANVSTDQTNSLLNVETQVDSSPHPAPITAGPGGRVTYVNVGQSDWLRLGLFVLTAKVVGDVVKGAYRAAAKRRGAES